MIQQVTKCVFCGDPSKITLVRTSDQKKVPACRQCVPRRIKLSWADNPIEVNLQNSPCPPPGSQKVNVIQ